MPCTNPKPAPTAAKPASTPQATGTVPSASVRTERYASHSRISTNATLSPLSTAASEMMRWRDSAAKTAGPLVTSRSCGRSSAAKRDSRVASARCCPSESISGARSATISSARSPSRDAQTPAERCGGVAPARLSMSTSVSPVGSRGSSEAASMPVGAATASIVALIARRRPSTEKRAASTAGLRR